MVRLIVENQFGFMKGRMVADSILIANEICHSILSGNAGGLVLKIDFDKAFDTIS